MFDCVFVRSFARRMGLPARRVVVAGLLVFCLSAAAQAQDTVKRGRKYKAPPPTARLEVTVTRASNGKPVENASVIFHPLADGKDAGNMELKTNDEGKAVIDVLELGSDVRLQIIAHGFQTYGEDYKVNKDSMAIAIKLHRPAEQYSIYKKSEGNAPDKDKPAVKPEDGKAGEEKPDAAKPAAPDAAPAPKDAPAADAKPKDAAPQQ